ncbi:glycoside hydrolase family 5 protein [bacterium]|nr:MAG: glycoside hydrolase family 5 protein [bacterium]
MKSRSSLLALLALASAGLTLQSPSQAQTTSLISNGNFETDANTDTWPDDWGQLKVGGSYQGENGNHFLRMTSPTAGTMVMAYREIKVPADVKAVELTWRQRVSNLKKGKQSWFDARIMMNWLDDARNKIDPGPPAPNVSRDTNGWEEKSVKFLVPDGATMLALMPTLFQVESGTFDIDDISLNATEAAPLEAEAKNRAEAQAAKLVQDAEKRQAKAAANVGADGSLLPNGDFQLDGNGDGTPDNWGGGKEGEMSWEKEADNRFLRLTSPEAGKMVMLYREIDLPANMKALELSWAQRISNFKRGKQNYFDARVLIEFKDAAGKKLPGPGAPYTQSNTNGWVNKNTKFLVPEGAVTMVFMPTLFQVESGTFDIDNLLLKSTDEGELRLAASKAAEEAKFINVEAEAPNKAKWPSELRVEGNKLINKAGKPVILTGVNIDSLQWSVRGERIMRNTLVAVDDWKSHMIRLPVKDDYWFGKSPDQKDGGASYRQLVDDTITLAANRGAYVLLDLHRFRAPNRSHIEFWKDAATRYKDNPAVVFEIFNEPHGTSWDIWRNGGFVEDKEAPADEDAFLSPEEKALNAKGFHAVGMQALVDAVRGTGAKNVIVAGGLDWAYDLSGVMNGFALEEKGGNGIVYSTHIYAGKRDWQNKVLVAAAKYPIIVSEFGANTKKFAFMPVESQEDAATWVPRVFGFIQKNNLNWTAFSFHPKSAPNMLQDWDYQPTPEWGAFVKRALAGEKFPDQGMR